jgi:hypothetical protein
VPELECDHADGCQNSAGCPVAILNTLKGSNMLRYSGAYRPDELGCSWQANGVRGEA